MAYDYDLTEEHGHAVAPAEHSGGGCAAHDHPVRALQRAAGNAAVVSAFQREEDERSPVLDVIGRGAGRALPADMQRSMSTAFGGTDFSDVRLHDDGAAKASAAAVGAKAYTTGHEIVLGDGVDISSADGQRTLAHELTHVVQQRSGRVDGNDRGDGVSLSDPQDRFEQEAEATADRLMMGEPAVALPGGQQSQMTQAATPGAPAVQRKGGDESPSVENVLDAAADEASDAAGNEIQQRLVGVTNVRDAHQARSVLDDVIGATQTLDSALGKHGNGVKENHKADNEAVKRSLDDYLTLNGEEMRASNDFQQRYTLARKRIAGLDGMITSFGDMAGAEFTSIDDLVKTETGKSPEHSGAAAAALGARNDDVTAKRSNVRRTRLTVANLETQLKTADVGAASTAKRVISATNAIESKAQASKAKPDEPDSAQVAAVKKKMAEVKSVVVAVGKAGKTAIEMTGVGKVATKAIGITEAMEPAIEKLGKGLGAMSGVGEGAGLELDPTKLVDYALDDIYREELTQAKAAQAVARGAAADLAAFGDAQALNAALDDYVRAAEAREELAKQIVEARTLLNEDVRALGAALDQAHDAKHGGKGGGGFALMSQFLSESEVALSEIDLAIQTGTLDRSASSAVEDERRKIVRERNSYHRADVIGDRVEVQTRHVYLGGTGADSSESLTSAAKLMLAELEQGKKIISNMRSRLSTSLGLGT